MKKQVIITKERLAIELASLPSLERKELTEKWRLLYGPEPPRGMGRKFLIRSIAYRLQEQLLGGLKSATRRYLETAIGENPTAKQLSPPIDIKPGTRLLREWHGVTHEVIIMDKEVLYKGKRYRSLSEVARVITGTRWSGPRFFGFKSKENMQ